MTCGGRGGTGWIKNRFDHGAIPYKQDRSITITIIHTTELEGRIIIILYVEEFGRIEAGFRGIGTTTLYLFRSVASWVVEKDYRARERGTF